MAVTALIDPQAPNEITLQGGFEHKEAITSLLAVKFSPKHKVWRTPLTWTACLNLRGTFGQDLIVDRTLTDWSLREHGQRVVPAMALRSAIDMEEGRSELNEATVSTTALGSEIGLYPHQTVGAAFMSTTERCLIADETGTGKSAQGIAALRSLNRREKDIFPVLVVTPSSVKIPWSREFETWFPDLKVVLVEGSAAQRRKLLQETAHVYIINWEQLAMHSRLAQYGSLAYKRCIEHEGMDPDVKPEKCEVHPRELNAIEFQTVIADELHRGCAPSKQTRALWYISDKAKFRFGLTGTPVQDNIEDYWFALRFVDPQSFPSKEKFINRYANQGMDNWGIRRIMGFRSDTQQEFFDVTMQYMRRMLKEVVLPFLPPVITQHRYIEMSGPQLKAYKEMKKSAMAELGGEILTTDSPLTKATRLLQFASSWGEIIKTEVEKPERFEPDWDAEDALFDDSDDFEYDLRLALPSNKITNFLADIKAGDFGNSSLVVFAQSRQLLELLSDQMTKAGYEHAKIVGGQNAKVRQQSIDDFQAGRVQFILVSIAAGGTGLTLTRADTMVFLQRPWSSTQFIQALARAHRIGSQIHESILVLHYISLNSIEQFQLDALDGKFERIEAILRDKDLLRQHLAAA